MSSARIVFFLLLVRLPWLGFSQSPSAVVEVTGDVATPLRLSAIELMALPRTSLVSRIGDKEVSHEGVWLHEVLKRAGAPSGTQLRGKAMASYVLAEARDGYQVVFSLAELDPLFTDNQVLLADRADGMPLSEADGPFRLIAPKDKRGARSIRMLKRLEVVQLRK